MPWAEADTGSSRIIKAAMPTIRRMLNSSEFDGLAVAKRGCAVKQNVLRVTIPKAFCGNRRINVMEPM